MIIDVCDAWTILHLQDDRSNKVWGYFLHDGCWYTFWSGVGQATSFKSHGEYRWDMPKLTTQKKNKGYEQITLEKLKLMDPNFYNTFSERFTVVKLMQSVGAL